MYTFINHYETNQSDVSEISTDVFLLNDNYLNPYRFPNEDYCDYFEDILAEPNVTSRLELPCFEFNKTLTCTIISIIQRKDELFLENFIEKYNIDNLE